MALHVQLLNYIRKYVVATGKTSRYRYNVGIETILSQAPKSAFADTGKVQRLDGSGLAGEQ